MTQLKNDELFMAIADAAMALGEDSSSRVGAFLRCSDGHSYVGWNTILPGLKMSDDRWQRPSKYNCIVTAEENAIYSAERRSLEGSTLYLTCLPSTLAVKLIALSGIHRIVCRQIAGSEIVRKTAAEARQILIDVGIVVDEI